MADEPFDQLTDLRRRAEAKLAHVVRRALPGLLPQDLEHLVGELQLYHIELEMQCEELQAAREEAEESRNRYRELYESVPLGYATLDATGRIVDMNPAGARLLGLEPGTAADAPFTPFIANQHADRFTLLCREVVTGQEARAEEFRMKGADGRRFIVSMQAAPVTTGPGKGRHLRSVFKDITHEKEIEETLRLHEAELVSERDLAQSSLTGALRRESQTARELLVSSLRLESIVQSAMDAIITVDESQQVLLFNGAAERMFQCPAREAIGQTLDKFIPTRFRAAHREHMQGFGRSGVTSRRMGELGTVTGLRCNGEEFPVEAAISHITVEGKKFFTVIMRDITERKRAERLMRQSEERYRRLISVAPLPIFVTRADRIIFVNDAGLRLFGAVRADELLGKSRLDLFHPDYHAVIHERSATLLEGSATVPPLEEKIIKLDGTVAVVEVSAARLVDEEGPAIVAMLRDIGEQKRLQEQLRKTERIAELGTVASGMAHEIGTPMNVILGRAEYLLERVTEEPIKKGLQTIVTQVERITKVMNQLLSFARRRAPQRRALDVKDVIEASVEIFQERLARGRIGVEMALDPACPAAHADADQLSQVLINLIMNAIHAMPDGGQLRIGLEADGDAIKMTVSDTGHGMPPEVAAHIFDPFFTTKEFGKGTGLGLTVVRGILEEHGGSIAVSSEVGKGTTFTIRLPKDGSPT
jgi:PAS domain S-box-containing protein